MAFVYEARKFETSLYVISVAPKPNEKGTMGKKNDPSARPLHQQLLITLRTICQNTRLSLIPIQ